MPVVLTTFYTAFSPSCFALLGLWLVIIGFNAGTWLDSGPIREKQVYAVAQVSLAPVAAIAALGAVIERITGNAIAIPAAPTVARRSTVRRLIPVR